MSETTIYYACGNSDCTLNMHVEWRSAAAIITVWDGKGRADKRSLPCADFVELLENLEVHPEENDEIDVYGYELATPIAGPWGDTTRFYIASRNYNFILKHTRDITSANTAL